MKKFVALYYFRDSTRQLQSRFMRFESASMAAAKRHGKAERQPEERLVSVELAQPSINCPNETTP